MIWHPPDPEPTPRCDDCGIEPEDELCAHGNCSSCARLLECCHFYCRAEDCDEPQFLCKHNYCTDHREDCLSCARESEVHTPGSLEEYYIQRDEERRARRCGGVA